ncbi:Rieske (2Fe-2S) protein [Haloplanus sp.]|uniref:Rieske (2Fe-2S) protein n=1 Tax=Haloplanus sp. TaxID=1961696 RepID=UPI00260ADA00|nr:Rieske 2Fe-2S domain-containing protein [Haloplanus sp.]
MDSDRRIAAVSDVPADTTFLFTVRDVDTDERREALLVRTPDEEVRGWLNYCRHLLDVRLDKGSGAPMRDGEVVCANHGAYFETDTGLCTFGPCEGAVLESVAVRVDGGDVYLADDDYAFAGVGGHDDSNGSTPSELGF